MHMGFILGSNAFQTCIWIIIPLWDSCNNFQFLDETWFLSYAKGQLTSKGLGILNSSKKRTKKVALKYHITVGWISVVNFWKNSGYQQVLSKLTDLYKF